MTTTTRRQADEVVKVDTTAALARIEEVAERHTLQALSTRGRLERGLLMARALAELRGMVRPMMGEFLQLANTPLGFLTDKRDGAGYPIEVVSECLIEAMLRGVYPIDNQFNIIAGRCYITKNGFRHLLRNHPGLTDLRLTLAPPRVLQGGAVVACKASWCLDGVADEIACDIPVRMQGSGGGADQILGKAERKLLARVYGQVTGSEHTLDGEVGEPPDTLPRPSKAEELAARLEAKERAGNGQQASAGQSATIRGLLRDLNVSEEGWSAYCAEHNLDAARLSHDQAEKAIADLRERKAEMEAMQEA